MLTKAATELKIDNKQNVDDPNWGTIMQQNDQCYHIFSIISNIPILQNIKCFRFGSKFSFSELEIGLHELYKATQHYERTTLLTKSVVKQLSLSQEDRDSIDQTYMSMDPHKRWEIEPGVFVEDRMYEYRKSQNHEHASHSFILDLGDVCWKTVFTDAQLKKLEETNVPPLAQPPQAMKKIIEKVQKRGEF
ncbi:hypothetical protein INT45_000939 [Circinella minor]|uniref:Uncharacterized protein n=1 Tax=Circinella minor TaxID=1195481 RepID=A0A8H7S2Z7_9FUNG|nr:hypothetical protein INT45_000939 [Circinella minor]